MRRNVTQRIVSIFDGVSYSDNHPYFTVPGKPSIFYA